MHFDCFFWKQKTTGYIGIGDAGNIVALCRNNLGVLIGILAVPVLRIAIYKIEYLTVGRVEFAHKTTFVTVANVVLGHSFVT